MESLQFYSGFHKMNIESNITARRYRADRTDNGFYEADLAEVRKCWSERVEGKVTNYLVGAGGKQTLLKPQELCQDVLAV